MKLQAKCRCNREIVAGMATSIEATLAFASWAQQMGDRLTPAAIKDHFGCSRATSYRWFAAYRAATERIAA